MRKRVFGSIFLTSLVTLLLTTGLLLLAVHAGLTNDMRQRLVTESSYLSAVDNIREELEKFGSVYADRLTLVAQDGTVLYDNRTNASKMENHAVRPEIAAAEKNGTGEDNRLSETFAKQTFYYAVRLKNGDVLRISATADSVFGALSNASPWIVLIILLALLVAALLAGWLTGLFLKPIEALDLHDPMKGEAYDELSPLLHRMDKQNRKIQAQMDELQRRQAEFDDITARMDEGLVLFSGKGMILFANHAARALFPHDSAEGSYLTLCRDANYIQVVEQALDGNGTHGKLERSGRIYELTASSVEEEQRMACCGAADRGYYRARACRAAAAGIYSQCVARTENAADQHHGLRGNHRGRHCQAGGRGAVCGQDPHGSAAAAGAHRGYHSPVPAG